MAAVEQMRWGSIINISSMAAFAAAPGIGRRSLRGVQGRGDLVDPDHGGRTRAGHPGECDRTRDHPDQDALRCHRPTKAIDLDELAASRPVRPRHAARRGGSAAVYLASPAARWVTGSDHPGRRMATAAARRSPDSSPMQSASAHSGDGLRDPRRHPGHARSARRLHRGRDQAARAAGRQHPVLRPSPRVRAHRLRPRRRATRRLGGAAARDAPPRRRRRMAAARASGRVRRPGRHQPEDGDHPRAPRRTRASACTTTCRTSRRSSATSRPC